MNVTQGWRGWIDNAVDLPRNQPFSAIIGSTPSRGARSPFLWNRAYEATKTAGRMIALDVSAARIEPLMNALANDPYYHGGAVTMPYKEVVAKWLGTDQLESEALLIGAVNALYRASDGRLKGSNTDGFAALKSLQSLLPCLENKRCVILGLGGVGKAVAAYLAAAGAQVMIVSRVPNRHSDFAFKCNADLHSWPIQPTAVSRTDVLINCTSLGSQVSASNVCPVGFDVISALPRHAVVFDVIYDPMETRLLKSAKKCRLIVKNGLEMNQLQAVLAFLKAYPNSDPVLVRQAME